MNRMTGERSHDRPHARDGRNRAQGRTSQSQGARRADDGDGGGRGRPPRPLRAGDGTSFLSPETSRAKATAAANFRASTTELSERAAKGGLFWHLVPSALPGQVLPTPGGTPIVIKGKVIGGIGCGGGTGEQDQECANAGAATIS